MILCFALFFFSKNGKEVHPKSELSNKQLRDENIKMLKSIQDLVKIRDKSRNNDIVKANHQQPEIENLVKLVQGFEERPNMFKWDNIIAIGDVYNSGSYPRFLPNQYLALQCYKIAAMCPDGYVAGVAQSKYIQARVHKVDDIDIEGIDLPEVYAIQICDMAQDAYQRVPFSKFDKPRSTVVEMDDDLDLNIHGEGERDRDREHHVFKEDAQNVHDHGVSRVTHHNIQKIQENADLKRDTVEKSIDEIKYRILKQKNIPNTIKADAIHVIGKLNGMQHSQFNTSEKEALVSVWDKIKSHENEENLVETLSKQLASSIEHGQIVCSSGKISRIVGTLDGVSNEPIRPLWALRDEISSIASKIQNDHDNIKNKNHAFEKRIKEDYIDKLGMSPKIIDPIIDEYKQGFE